LGNTKNSQIASENIQETQSIGELELGAFKKELYDKFNLHVTFRCPDCGDVSHVWLVMFYNGDTYCRKCKRNKIMDPEDRKIVDERGIIV